VQLIAQTEAPKTMRSGWEDEQFDRIPPAHGAELRANHEIGLLYEPMKTGKCSDLE
jgi:hypothetical protein